MQSALQHIRSIYVPIYKYNHIVSVQNLFYDSVPLSVLSLRTQKAQPIATVPIENTW
jgi:hypothetical protein